MRVPGATHHVHEEQPEAVATHLLKLLDIEPRKPCVLTVERPRADASPTAIQELEVALLVRLEGPRGGASLLLGPLGLGWADRVDAPRGQRHKQLDHDKVRVHEHDNSVILDRSSDEQNVKYLRDFKNAFYAKSQ